MSSFPMKTTDTPLQPLSSLSNSSLMTSSVPSSTSTSTFQPLPPQKQDGLLSFFLLFHSF